MSTSNLWAFYVSQAPTKVIGETKNLARYPASTPAFLHHWKMTLGRLLKFKKIVNKFTFFKIKKLFGVIIYMKYKILALLFINNIVVGFG